MHFNYGVNERTLCGKNNNENTGMILFKVKQLFINKIKMFGILSQITQCKNFRKVNFV